LQAPAMTIATPIKDKQGNLIAVLAGRLNLIDLSEIMTRSSSKSSTEDTYLVNKFNFFITEPRFGKGFMLKKSVHTQGVKKALLHSDGTGFYEDYRGVPVIGAYHWIPEWELCMITEIDQAEAFVSILRLRKNILMLFTGALLISFLAGLALARMFTRPIQRLIKETGKISLGHRDFRADTLARDEIGDLARAFEGMVRQLETTLVSRDELKAEIIERKSAEKKLTDVLVDLERSNRDLQQFAYAASHDLQEPLRMVSSYCQLLADRYQNQLDEKAHKYIHYAVDGAIRMQALINDLLSYSRVTTRGSDLQAVDSHTALGSALANLHNAIQESGALVTSAELPLVWADPTQLAQVFQNLIGNSIKYRGSDLPRIHISAQKMDKDWRFGVTDNGIGIDLQYKDKIFTIFQRLHTRDEYPGTGIGLALCKRIMERHGGVIWFESELGKGSTFYFTMKGTEL
jgi:signal transduction histidine kinase